MGWLAGFLGVADSYRLYNGTIGKRLIYDAADKYIRRRDEMLNSVMNLFVESNTEDYTEKYLLPGNGELQQRGGDGVFGAVKATGSWDVGYPLKEFGAAVVVNRVDMAYMTARNLQRHIETVDRQNINTMRYELLYTLFNNTAKTWNDQHYGSITVQPLANGDSVLYPPIEGTTAEATQNNYLVSGYVATAISDTNNPYIVIRQQLEQNFGKYTGGDEIYVFINKDEVPETAALADFVPVPDNWVNVGDDTATPRNMPRFPGRLLGRAYGCWVVEWDWIPSGYMMAVHGAEPAPLRKRVDESDTGLTVGLHLVTDNVDAPFHEWEWMNRFGFGVGNRLNGVVMQFKASGSYDIPTLYA